MPGPAYLNSDELYSTTYLLYGNLSFAYAYFFSAVVDSVNQQNDNVSSMFTICLIVYIILACIVTVAIWIPYIQTKKRIV